MNTSRQHDLRICYFVRGRFLALILIAIITLAALTSCATVGSPNNDQALKLSTQIATVVAIKQFQGREAEAAKKIGEIASEMVTFFDSGALPFSAFETLLDSKISALNLAPADQIIAQTLKNTLLENFRLEIDENQVLTPETRFNISKIASWVRDVAKLYESVQPTTPGAQTHAISESTSFG